MSKSKMGTKKAVLKESFLGALNSKSFSELTSPTFSMPPVHLVKSAIYVEDVLDIFINLLNEVGSKKAVGQINLGEKIREIINDVLERNLVGADFTWVLSSEIIALLKEMGINTDNEEIV